MRRLIVKPLSQINSADDAIEIAKKTLVAAGYNIYWIMEARRIDSEWTVSAKILATDMIRIDFLIFKREKNTSET
jgi:hypothetical protein